MLAEEDTQRVACVRVWLYPYRAGRGPAALRQEAGPIAFVSETLYGGLAAHTPTQAEHLGVEGNHGRGKGHHLHKWLRPRVLVRLFQTGHCQTHRSVSAWVAELIDW